MPQTMTTPRRNNLLSNIGVRTLEDRKFGLKKVEFLKPTDARSLTLQTFFNILAEAWKIGGTQGLRYINNQINKVINNDERRTAIVAALQSLEKPYPTTVNAVSTNGVSILHARKCPDIAPVDGVGVKFCFMDYLKPGTQTTSVGFYVCSDVLGSSIQYHLICSFEGCSIENLARFYADQGVEMTTIAQDPAT